MSKYGKQPVTYTNNLMLQQLVWINNEVYNNCRFMNLYIPDLFRTYFTNGILSSKSEIFDYLYDNQKAPNEVTITGSSSYEYTNEVYIDPLINDKLIKSLLYFGYSAENFNNITNFNENTIKINNQDIFILNNLVSNSLYSGSLTQNDKNAFFNKSNINDFKNYLNKKYSVTTLFYQIINFFILMDKSYNKFTESKKYIDKFLIQWEYSFNYNSNTGKILNNKILREGNIINARNNFVKFRTKVIKNNCEFTPINDGIDFNAQFFSMLLLALEVYTDVYQEFLYNFANLNGAPLYTSKQSEKCYFKSDYMNDQYYQKTKKVYEIYLENKKMQYPNLYLENIEIPKFFFNKTILNIHYVTLNNYKNINLNKNNIMENIDNIIFDLDTSLSNDDIIIFDGEYNMNITDTKYIGWFTCEFFIDDIKHYLVENNININDENNIHLEASEDDINLYILKSN